MLSTVSSTDRVGETKYVVKNGAGETLPPGSYFVIRAGDVFAAAGLWSYCHSLETVLELDSDVQFLRPEQREHLLEIADQAAHLAKSWQAAGLGRVPD